MKRTATILASLSAAFLVLSIPPDTPSLDGSPESGGAFVWNQDSLWLALESQYAAARRSDCSRTSEASDLRVSTLRSRAVALFDSSLAASHPLFDSLEVGLFRLAPSVAACPDHLPDYLALYERIRRGVKTQSRYWDVEDRRVRDRIYRSLYGGRAAAEEVMLQHPDRIVTLTIAQEEPSATPSVEVNGVRIHSGDILVSRGGYPTSALIARGNDYPGNFSHIALVHVDEETGRASAIESHIEIGVAVATPEQYLADKKLRIMVLRPRANLSAMLADPMLPHRAASQALRRANEGHVPYDFEMDYRDPSKLFCSEVASSVYRDLGIDLWMGISTISSPGLRRWLSSFGVRHFETQEPSDLEYDPQLVVVAEWRDPIALFQDHVDNAVVDAMLEGAERGDKLTFSWYELAPARLAKAYSWTMVRAGSTGPIPDGMSAAAALRNKSFSDRHARIAAIVRGEATRLESEQGYRPAYWTLLDLARRTAAEIE